MKYLLAPLLALSLVGCSLLDGPTVSEIEPSATPSPIARSADLLVFGGFSRRFTGFEPNFVQTIYQGYRLALSEVNGQVAGLTVELVPEIPDEISNAVIGEDTFRGEREMARAMIAFSKSEPRLVAVMGPNQWFARDDGSIEALCQAGVVMLSPALADPGATATGCPAQHFFRTVASVGSSGRVAARYLYEEDIKRVLVLLARSDGTRPLPIWRSQLSAFSAEARKSGTTVIAQRDLTKVTAREIRALDPELVLVLGVADAAEADALLRLRGQIISVPFMSTEMGLPKDFDKIGRAYKPLGPMLLATSAFEPSLYLGHRDFFQRWREQVDPELAPDEEILAMDSYAAMKALLASIERIASSGVVAPRDIALRLPGALASLEISGAPYGATWGFTGSGDRYPTIGGIYTVDLTFAQDIFIVPLRDVRY